MRFRDSRFGLGKDASPNAFRQALQSAILLYFADGTNGLDFDFSKTDRLFQSDGVTPADSAGESINTALECHAWAGRSFAEQVAQASNVLPPFVSAGTGWTVTNADATHKVTFADGSAHFEVSSSTPVTALAANAVLTTSLFYYLTGQIATWVGGALKFDVPGSSITLPAAAGLFERILKASTANLSFYRSGAGVTDLTFGNLVAKLIAGSHGYQSTLASQPKWQTGGWARFDGADNWLTGKIPGTTGFIMARLLPTAGAALQVLAGAIGASGTDRLLLGVDASNYPTCRVGSGAALAGAGSIAGVDGSIGVRWNGTVVDLLVNGIVVATQAQSGAPTTTTPLRIGACNTNGTAADFFTGDAKRVIEGNKALTDEMAAAFHAELMAA